MHLPGDRRFKGPIATGATIGLVLAAAEAYSEYHTFHPGEGSPSYTVGILVLFYRFGLAFLPVALLPFLAVALGRTRRRTALRGFAFFLSLWLVALLGNYAAARVRVSGIDALTQATQPLVDAIRRYHGTHGRPPGDLAALYPEFLPSGFELGTSGCTGPFYEPAPNIVPFSEGNPWALTYYCRTYTVDYLFYLPLQNYPPHIERFDGWGYHGG